MSQAARREPLIIGVAGGTASGKTSVCLEVMRKLQLEDRDDKPVVMISMDSFYKVLSPTELEQAYASNYNFDHPSAFDWELLLSSLEGIRRGEPTRIPSYDFKTHSRTEEGSVLVEAPQVVLIEGILILFEPRIRELLAMAIFVDEDSDTRLARRAERDMRERGRDMQSILRQYLTFVKPSFDEYIFPTKRYADIIFPRGKENQVAINLIVQHIQDALRERGDGAPAKRQGTDYQEISQ